MFRAVAVKEQRSSSELKNNFQYRVAPSTDNGDYYYMTGVFRTSEQRVTGTLNWFNKYGFKNEILVVEEKATYQTDELISNIGGYLGLVLGLRIVYFQKLINITKNLDDMLMVVFVWRARIRELLQKAF